MLKKAIYAAAIAALLLSLLIWGVIQLVRPDKALDLHYEEVTVFDKMLDIVKTRKPEVQLTEQDVNHLGKQFLSHHRVLPHDMTITGAQFKLHGHVLEADLNLLWRDKVPVAAKLFFQVTWKNPNVEIVHTRTNIKQMQVPKTWVHMDPIRIPLSQYLPGLIAIKDVVFDPDAIRISLRLK
jgi:hypothetical protein